MRRSSKTNKLIAMCLVIVWLIPMLVRTTALQAWGNDSFATATTISVGSSVFVEVQEAEEKVYLKFVPTATGEYVIMTGNHTGDPKIWLYDSSYNQLAYSDDASNRNSWLEYQLVSGQTYYIAAGHYRTNVGTYYLTVLRKAGMQYGTFNNNFYYCRNVSTSKYLDIHGPYAQELVHQWTYSTGEQQKWLIQEHPDGYVTIRSQYGDKKYVGISNSNIGEDNIKLFDTISSSTQWNVYVLSGRYIFEPVLAKGKALYAPDTGTGTEMQLAWIAQMDTKCRWYLNGYSYSGLTFSAFDVGDSSENEVAIVSEWLTDMGYTNIGAFNNADGYIHAQTIKDIGRYSDVVYINGHGEKYGNMRIQDSLGTVKEYLCADISCEDSYAYPYLTKTVIGADWLANSTTKTESHWDDGFKWGILAQCAQLNYGSSVGAGNHWNSMNSAGMWARTMLGAGTRAHGYVGYYNTAPGGSTHTDRLEQFFDYCKNDNYSIVDAWASAHTYLVGSSDWAAVYHSVNENDTFQSMAECTAAGNPYEIFYIARSQNETELTLEANENLTDNVVLTNQVQNIQSIGYPAFTTATSDNGTTYEQAIYTQLQRVLPSESDSRLSIEDNGQIIYKSGGRSWSGEVFENTLTNEQAIREALQLLSELGIAPQNEYRATVSNIQRYNVALDGTINNSPEVIEYMVSFYRTYNGIDVISDKEDGILISFNANGITELRYLWRDIAATERIQNNNPTYITVNQAQEAYRSELAANTLASSSNIDENSDAANVITAFLEIDNEVHPVYVFSSDNGYSNAIFVDLVTGEVLTFDN